MVGMWAGVLNIASSANSCDAAVERGLDFTTYCIVTGNIAIAITVLLALANGHRRSLPGEVSDLAARGADRRVGGGSGGNGGDGGDWGDGEGRSFQDEVAG